MIQDALRHGDSVILSFKGVTLLTSAFLNDALGRLYGEYTEEEIERRVHRVDICPEDDALLRRVATTAKAYFSNRAQVPGSDQEDEN
jgi:hypothetical protein